MFNWSDHTAGRHSICQTTCWIRNTSTFIKPALLLTPEPTIQHTPGLVMRMAFYCRLIWLPAFSQRSEDSKSVKQILILPITSVGWVNVSVGIHCHHFIVEANFWNSYGLIWETDFSTSVFLALIELSRFDRVCRPSLNRHFVIHILLLITGHGTAIEPLHYISGLQLCLNDINGHQLSKLAAVMIILSPH